MDLSFRALGDAHRREIVALLAERALTVNQLHKHFRFSQPALSKHLRILRDAKLVTVESDGRFRRYRLAGAALGEMATWLLRYHRFWTQRLDALGNVLDEEAARTKAERGGRQR